MDACQWTSPDVQLKSDSAGVLECLQRSMAENDDEIFNENKQLSSGPTNITTSLPDLKTSIPNSYYSPSSMDCQTTLLNNKIPPSPSAMAGQGVLHANPLDTIDYQSVNVNNNEPRRNGYFLPSPGSNYGQSPPVTSDYGGHQRYAPGPNGPAGQPPPHHYQQQGYPQAYHNSVAQQQFAANQLAAQQQQAFQQRQSPQTHQQQISSRQQQQQQLGHYQQNSTHANPSQPPQYPPTSSQQQNSNPHFPQQSTQATSMSSGHFTMLANASSSMPPTSGRAPSYPTSQPLPPSGVGAASGVGTTTTGSAATGPGGGGSTFYNRPTSCSTPYQDSYSSYNMPPTPSSDYYRSDNYTPSGRQSTSFIPSDLQQVTPTIQDLASMSPLPPTPLHTPSSVQDQDSNSYGFPSSSSSPTSRFPASNSTTTTSMNPTRVPTPGGSGGGAGGGGGFSQRPSPTQGYSNPNQPLPPTATPTSTAHNYNIYNQTHAAQSQTNYQNPTNYQNHANNSYHNLPEQQRPPYPPTHPFSHSQQGTQVPGHRIGLVDSAAINPSNNPNMQNLIHSQYSMQPNVGQPNEFNISSNQNISSSPSSITTTISGTAANYYACPPGQAPPGNNNNNFTYTNGSHFQYQPQPPHSYPGFAANPPLPGGGCAQGNTEMRSIDYDGVGTTEMFHDALEYIAPEVVNENRDSLFNPISALTDTLLENNFDVQPPTEEEQAYAYAANGYDTGEEVQRYDGVQRLKDEKQRKAKLIDVIKVFRCKVCGFRSSDKVKAVKHTIESHSRPKLNKKARFACGTCHNHYASLKTCCEHIGEIHPSANTAILKDGKLFKQVMIEKKKKPVKDLEAIKAANAEETAQRIAWRRKILREQGMFMCEFKGCNLRFRKEESLSYHLRCHLENPSEEARFECPTCQWQPRKWYSLANHLWTEHQVDIELHNCDECDYKTYSLSTLEKVHKLTHGEAKNFECDQCKRGFKNIKQLRNHKFYSHSAHTKTEQYKQQQMVTCETCNLELNKKNLKTHIKKVHDKQPIQLKCGECDFKSASGHSLKTHMRVHIPTPFCCEQCGFLSMDKAVHKRHVAQHAVDKRYKCKYCEYSSVQSTTYKDHIKRKHPEKVDEIILKCDMCNFESINESKLKQHKVKKHM